MDAILLFANEEERTIYVLQHRTKKFAASHYYYIGSGIIIVPPLQNICRNPQWSANSIPYRATWSAEPVPWEGSYKRANGESRICQLHRDSRYAELATLAYIKLLNVQQ